MKTSKLELDLAQEFGKQFHTSGITPWAPIMDKAFCAMFSNAPNVELMKAWTKGLNKAVAKSMMETE